MKKFLYFSMRLALLGCIAFAACGAVFAAPFTVDATNDTQDVSPGDGICIDSNGRCSLRAAISEANSLPGDDVITLPAGIYTTTLTGANENANVGGDFDITSNITINGAGSGSTFIQAATTAGTATERPLHISAASAPNTATVVINDVTVRNGRYIIAGIGGAGLRVEGTGTNATLNNVVIRDNQEHSRGAGIYLVFGSPLLTLNNCLIANNSINFTGGSADARGGGILISSGNAIINNTTISGNTVNSSVSHTFGAGIMMLGGTLDLNNSSVSNNRATATASFLGNGGGIYNLGATLNIINSTVDGNYADSAGGVRTLAQDTEAITTINNSSIVNNNSVYGGGGITNIALGNGNSTLNLNNSTVSRNASQTRAGGIWNLTETGGTTNTGFAIANINFSTIAENFLISNGEAGGVLNEIHSSMRQPTTITLRLKNSVIANNNAGNNGFAPDIEGTFTSQGYNLIENTEAAWFTPTVGDTTGIDPSLGALGLNGGTTLNYLPNPGSPLVDRIPNGVNGCGGFDQRGVSRPTDSDMNGISACEKGSTERASAPTAASVSVTGRILSSSGRGIVNAVVMMTDPNGNTRFARTSTFGYYRFDDVQIGGTYIFTVSSKRYEFAATVRTITEETRDLNFLAP